MAHGRQRRKLDSADERVQLVMAVTRLAGQVLVIVHDWLVGGGPGWPTNR